MEIILASPAGISSWTARTLTLNVNSWASDDVSLLDDCELQLPLERELLHQRFLSQSFVSVVDEELSEVEMLVSFALNSMLHSEIWET